jgi:hypothetical protein
MPTATAVKVFDPEYRLTLSSERKKWLVSPSPFWYARMAYTPRPRSATDRRNCVKIDGFIGIPP